MCHHTKLLYIIDYTLFTEIYSHDLFYNWNFVPLNLFHIFAQPLTHFSLAFTSLLAIRLSILSWLLLCFIKFHIEVRLHGICFSLSDLFYLP